MTLIEPDDRQRRPYSSNWRKPVFVLAVLLMLLVPLYAVIPTSAAPNANPHASKTLLDDAAANLDQTFQVIVQGKGNHGHDAAANAVHGKGHAQLGAVADMGVVTQVSGKDLADLAKDPNVKYVELDAPLDSSSLLDPSKLVTTYDKTIGATGLWTSRSTYTGAGVGVAVVDTGINQDTDFGNRIVLSKQFNSESNGLTDGSGHGTHVAGIIGGNSTNNWWFSGQYVGVAPQANLISAKVGYANGQSYTSDLVNAIDWVIANRQAYNIRVMNLSLVSSTAESYQTSILDAEVERAWFNGIFVVVAAGNSGPNTMLYPPANDPFVVTVGGEDEMGTSSTSDDTMISWSSYGTTQDGFSKPDLVAPGRHITSVLASTNSTLAQDFPDRITGNQYIWLSGTSMSAAVVSGAAALAFQAHPDWSNDQLKAALTASAKQLGTTNIWGKVVSSYPGQGAGRLDVGAAITLNAPAPANQGTPISGQLIGPNGGTLYDTSSWSSSSWSSSSWATSSWSSSSWSSSSWSSSSWSSSSSSS